MPVLPMFHPSLAGRLLSNEAAFKPWYSEGPWFWGRQTEDSNFWGPVLETSK